MILLRKKLKNLKNKLNRQELRFKKSKNNANIIEAGFNNFKFDLKI